MIKSFFLFLSLLACLCFISCKHSDNNNEKSYQFNLESYIKEFCTTTKSPEIQAKFSSLIGVIDFYKKNEYKPIWFSNDSLNSNGEKVLFQLENAIAYGLDPNFYHVNVIKFSLDKYKNGKRYYKNLTQAITELLLTDSYLLFCHHLASGWSKPLVISDELKECSINTKLLKWIKEDKLEDIIDTIEYKQLHYKNLRKAWTNFYTSLKNINNDSVPFVAQDSILAYKMATKKLMSFNILSEKDRNVNAKIRQAVKRYQYLFGIQENGVLDSNTIRSLNKRIDFFYNQCISSLEKLKQLEIEKDNFVLINIPTYTLFWVEMGELAATHKVVVGTSKNQTPELESTISKFTLFPEWNVPYKIATKEILPCVRNNVKYLDKHKYVISTGSGVVVDPASVNWKKLNNSNFPYRVKQTSGDHNSLGLLKFFFSNSNDVYLHDTPQKNFFNRTIRAYSHGCMRLHNPFNFLKLVLEHQYGICHLSEQRQKELNIFEKQKRKFKKIIEEEENAPMIDTVNVHLKNRIKKDFFLKRSIPIYVTYFTTFYDFDGNVLFYPDVYKRDTTYHKSLEKYRQKQMKIWN